MDRRDFIKSIGGGVVLTLSSPNIAATTVTDLTTMHDLVEPPFDARPHTWWHWMNGNVSAAGITRDLEAMARVGIGGVHLFDVGSGIPAGPVVSLSPEWFSLVDHAAREADRLNLSLTLHNCPGWSSTGGPWVTPDKAMQQLVWSEAFVAGGGDVELALPQPLTNLDFYRDACVIAFPSTAGETLPLENRAASLDVDGRSLPLDRLSSAVNGDPIAMRPVAGGPATLTLRFATPYEARAIAVLGLRDDARGALRPPPLGLVLEASDDGVTFRKVATLVGGAPFGPTAMHPATATFAPARARFFRLSTPNPVDIRDISLSSGDRLPGWVVKSNLWRQANLQPDLSDAAAEGVVDPATVIDVSKHVDGGVLRWTVPPGEWTVMRFGHTATGRKQNASTDAGLGLEIDKFSPAALDFHFDRFFGPMLKGLAPLIARGKAGALIDSYEVAAQNWTSGFESEFATRTGYSIVPFLPAMSGRVVGGRARSERFLWDLRRTQADLIADSYWGRFAERCRQSGLISHTEPYGPQLGPMDELQVGARIDYPMGEFWVRTNHLVPTMKIAASVAHVHGKKIVGAEAFTGRGDYSKWQEHPFALKALGDMMFCHGLQNMIFHRYAHQPQHEQVVPGMTMGPWGMHFDRTNTWWEQSASWLRYLARCQHLLRKGRFVADFLVYVGEDAPVETPTRGRFSATFPVLDPAPPAGHDYDLCDAGAIFDRVTIVDGDVVLPDGIRYRMLVLPPARTMRLAMIERLAALVQGGMSLMGARPLAMPGLIDDEPSKRRFDELCELLWGPNKAQTEPRKVGRGKVFPVVDYAIATRALALTADFRVVDGRPDSDIHYIHRRDGDTDLYFVCNRLRRDETIECAFRVSGRSPELLDPLTGKIVPAMLTREADGVTLVTLQLAPAGSVFVLFRRPAGPQQIARIERIGSAVASVGNERAGISEPFTTMLWAKPETDVSLEALAAGSANFSIGPESASGMAGANAVSFAIYPPSGDRYGPNHVCAGLVVGRNVIAAYVRGRNVFAPVLVAPRPVAGWTHLAVVQQEGRATLFVDGKMERRGLATDLIVHPGNGFAHDRMAWPAFEGDIADLIVIPRALTPAQIADAAAQQLPLPPAPTDWTQRLEGSGGVLAWRAGDYRTTMADGSVRTLNTGTIPLPIPLTEAWQVSLQSERGAPPEIGLRNLVSLHRHENAAVRHFAGTARYATTFTLAKRPRSPQRLFLDLGRVEVIAEVALNGKPLGTLWARPYMIDVTDAVRPGLNRLEVAVTNLWPNALIGDEQLPPEHIYDRVAFWQTGGISKMPDWFVAGQPKPVGGRRTFATWQHFTAQSPLLESGLLGPVVLRAAGVIATPAQ